MLLVLRYTKYQLSFLLCSTYLLMMNHFEKFHPEFLRQWGPFSANVYNTGILCVLDVAQSKLFTFDNIYIRNVTLTNVSHSNH